MSILMPCPIRVNLAVKGGIAIGDPYVRCYSIRLKTTIDSNVPVLRNGCGGVHAPIQLEVVQQNNALT